MPILINRETGAAENVPESAAQSTHDVPLNDPEGKPVIAPADQAAQLLQQGYSQPSTQQLHSLLETTKYGTTEETAKAALEQAASAGTFGLSTGLEEMQGVRPYDIRKRREVLEAQHPELAIGATAAGLLGTAGIGEGALLEKAGAKVAEKTAQALGESAAARIGSQAAKAAVENAVYAGGDEASKMFMGDPNQTVETAAANIGMSGLLGAGFGAGIGGASELWKSTAGKSVEGLMAAMQNRSAGLPIELKTAANLDLAPEIESALGGGPKAQEAAATLMESQTKAGGKFQDAMANFKRQVSDALGESFGKTASDIEDLQHLSSYETGKTFQKALGDEIAEKVEPISKKYDEITEKFKNTQLTEADKNTIASQVADAINEQGLAKGPNDSALKLANKVLEQLPKQETVQDLRKYAQGLYQAAPFGSETYQIGKTLRNIISGVQDSIIGREAGADFALTQAEYGRFKGLLQELNDRLHLGREGKAGAQTFVEALRSMEPESVVKRLGLKDDVNLQKLLGEHFPGTAELARQQEISGLLKKSLNKNGELDSNKLLKNVSALSPELKSYLVPEAAAQRIDAIKQLLQRLPQRMNPSGTAKTLDALWSKIPASASAMAAMITGHSPIAGAIVGQMAHYLGRELPDAVKLSMLKYMGSAERISAPGFKAATELASAMLKGEQKLDKSVSEVLGGKAADITEPSAKELERLKDQVDKLTADPNKLLDAQNHIGHYLPDHGAVLSMTAARNLQYLASLRPNTEALTPFDGKRVASNEQEADYEQALIIAQAPLTVLKDVKNGSITQKQLQHLQVMYPGLYQRMVNKLGQQMYQNEKLDSVPYKTQLGLSAFMKQPVSASLAPQAIMSAQLSSLQAPQPQKQPSPTGSGSRLQKLDRMPAAYATPAQSRDMHRAGFRQ